MSILALSHPGEVLFEDFMKPCGLTPARVAHDLGLTPHRIAQIIGGQRAITADTALRLARYLGTTPAIWLRLQIRYDLAIAQETVGKTIRRDVKPIRSRAGRSSGQPA